jgi:predicted O-methyltransferase YrrM
MGLRTWLGLKAPKETPPDFMPWFAGKEFTTDWTTSNLATWRTHLEPLRAATEVLEIGSFEGRSTIFFLNFFSAARITCIDPFLKRPGRPDAVGDSEQRFDGNLAEFRERLRKIKGRSIPELDALSRAMERFDVIYVDGAHDRTAVLIDSLLAWPMLKPGGVMIWDDYKWMRHQRAVADRPEQAIDTFLSLHKDELAVVHQAYQVMARKHPRTEH